MGVLRLRCGDCGFFADLVFAAIDYDYAARISPTTSTTIGTYSFTPEAEPTVRVTVSGTFGNGDVPNTALSDYYLGFGADETAVEVANCDKSIALEGLPMELQRVL